MITDKFDNLIQELGTVLKIKLKPDKNNACLLRFKNGMQIQLEADSRSEKLILASDLGQIPQGRFRENIFREALKANGLPPPRNGIFAYGKKNFNIRRCSRDLLFIFCSFSAGRVCSKWWRWSRAVRKNCR